MIRRAVLNDLEQLNPSIIISETLTAIYKANAE
jgi:hypothetical protein